jgi:glycosyltransferase involved in cell wall biosynthesis
MKKQNKKLKIAFVCIYSYPSICGVWSRVYSLSQMLIEKGHEVHVFSTNVIKGTDKESCDFEIHEKINIHRFKPYFSFGENLKFWNFFSQLKELNPDIIIAEVYRHPHTALALKVAKKLKKPIFLTTHAPFVEPELRSRLGNFLSNFYDKFYGRRTLSRFEKILTITKWELPFLQKIGIDKKKLVYIPNGIPKEFFTIKKKEGHGLLFLGRIAPVKNLETLIAAVAIVSKKYPLIELKLVGPAEQDYKEKLESMIKTLNLQNNIQFIPAIYDLKKKINMIDKSAIFILPSKREAMPQSLIETMARRKIVIASNNKGASEIINNKKSGFIFSTYNSERLAELLLFCLDKRNKSRLDKIREQAFLKSTNFKWKTIFEEFYKLFLKYAKK